MVWGRVDEMGGGRIGRDEEKRPRNESRKGDSCWVRWVLVVDFIGAGGSW